MILEAIISPSFDASSATLVMKIVDLDTQETIPFARIELINENGKNEYSAENGQIVIPNIVEGNYDIWVSFVGYYSFFIKDHKLTSDNDNWLTVGLCMAI